MTSHSRCFVALVLVGVSAAWAHAQTATAYRGFALGSAVTSVTAKANLPATDVRTVHRRPGVIQTLEWRRPYAMGQSALADHDPVNRIVFSFLDDQLYRIVVDYDRDRTEGLTGADVIELMAGAYGPPTPPSAIRPTLPGVDATGLPIAQWVNDDDTVVLYQSPGFSGRSTAMVFTLVVSSPRLAALSRAIAADALRLDASEAPQVEMARQKKEADEDRESAEKARDINKRAFTP